LRSPTTEASGNLFGVYREIVVPSAIDHGHFVFPFGTLALADCCGLESHRFGAFGAQAFDFLLNIARARVGELAIELVPALIDGKTRIRASLGLNDEREPIRSRNG
jgi:hypothetical protein